MTLKQALFAEYYYTKGSESFGNGVDSARRAGYRGDTNQLAQRAHELVNNSKVKALKETLQAETEADTAYTIQLYQQELEQARQRAITGRSNAAEVSAIVAKGRSMGYDKDNRLDKDTVEDISKAEAEDRRAFTAWQLRQQLAVKQA